MNGLASQHGDCPGGFEHDTVKVRASEPLGLRTLLCPPRGRGCSLILSLVGRRSGWPIGGALFNELTLVPLYAAHFRHLDFFPVWSSTDGLGLGTPVLLYYQKTFFYVSGFLFILFGGDLKPTLILSIAIFLAVGAYGMRQALGLITDSRWLQAIGSLGFLFTNYVFTDWLARGDLPEVLRHDDCSLAALSVPQPGKEPARLAADHSHHGVTRRRPQRHRPSFGIHTDRDRNHVPRHRRTSWSPGRCLAASHRSRGHGDPVGTDTSGRAAILPVLRSSFQSQSLRPNGLGQLRPITVVFRRHPVPLARCLQFWSLSFCPDRLFPLDAHRHRRCGGTHPLGSHRTTAGPYPWDGNSTSLVPCYWSSASASICSCRSRCPCSSSCSVAPPGHRLPLSDAGVHYPAVCHPGRRHSQRRVPRLSDLEDSKGGGGHLAAFPASTLPTHRNVEDGRVLGYPGQRISQHNVVGTTRRHGLSHLWRLLLGEWIPLPGVPAQGR